MISSSAPKLTPLHEEHLKGGARMMEFGGWQMPVQYSGVLDEHHAVRGAVGVFDISHMGQFIVRGIGAHQWINYVLSNNVNRLDNGECQYTFLLNDRGGVIDDLIVYRYGDEEFLFVVNAARTDVDFDWMQQHLHEGVTLENRSADYAGFAVQGPKSVQLFEMFFGDTLSRPARNEIKRHQCDGAEFLIARTGYTGEDGFEIFLPARQATKTWREILEKGNALGIKPCGLAARDTLRLEMCYPLNGADLSPDYTPLESGLSIFVDMQKDNFIGREALQTQREAGIKQRLVPFRMKEKGPPPRSHCAVFKDGEKIGETSSGTFSPTLNIGIGMAYIPTRLAHINEDIEIEIRGRRLPATIEKKPLYRPQ